MRSQVSVITAPAVLRITASSTSIHAFYKLPKDFPIEMGAIIEPYGCAMHAVDRAELTHTDVLVVSGPGALSV